MSNVLTTFLIAVGMDTTGFDKGTRDIDRGLQGVKMSTLAISGAILGVFGAVATAAINTAHNVDQLALATNNLNTNKQFVYNLGGALKLMGGDAADALKEVKGIEDALSNLQLKGDVGPFNDLAAAGVDLTHLTDKKSAESFLSTLAEQLPGLNNNQRQVVQKSLGLSDATMKSLQNGPQSFEALLQRSQDLTGTITQLTEDSRKLSENFATFGLQLTGITNELTEKTLPGLVGLSEWANQFVKEHREDISGAIDTVADHPAATVALGGGAAASVLGALISKLGLTTLGGISSSLGVYGQAVGGATLATDTIFNTLEAHYPGLKSTEQSIDQGARDMGLGKLVDFSDWLFNTDKGQVPKGTTDSFRPTDSSNYTPDTMPTPYKEVPTRSEEDNDTLVKAIQAAKINVANSVNLNVSLDGQALESKIKEVHEQSNYSTIDDMRSSTAR